MKISVDMPRSTPKKYYKHLMRMLRCMVRAQIENGYYAEHLKEMLIYGHSIYPEECYELDLQRAFQLMDGLKPKKLLTKTKFNSLLSG